jgi:hypothetical protein
MNGDAEAVEVTNLVDLIGRLAEPAEPAPVAMTPQTPGWTVLAILTALLPGWLAWLALRHWRANAYRRAALAELQRAGDDPAAIADILRRAALAAWPRERVASLSGRDWLDFLDGTGGGGFSDGPGWALAQAPYARDPHPVPGLRDLAVRWVRRHRREAAP